MWRQLPSCARSRRQPRRREGQSGHARSTALPERRLRRLPLADRHTASRSDLGRFGGQPSRAERRKDPHRRPGISDPAHKRTKCDDRSRISGRRDGAGNRIARAQGQAERREGARCVHRVAARRMTPSSRSLADLPSRPASGGHTGRSTRTTPLARGRGEAHAWRRGTTGSQSTLTADGGAPTAHTAPGSWARSKG
jgi:hypothetical protein